MAARKERPNRAHANDKCRERIKTSLLLNKLEDHILTNSDLSPTQIKAAEILLKKTLPDLKQLEHIGNPDKPVEHNHTLRPQLSKEEWLSAHGVGTTSWPTE